MLTPDKIKEYRFQPAGQGVYRADDVDRFFASVSADYEKIYTDHGELIDRVRMLVKKVKDLEAEITRYEEQENLIKKTLIVAQKKADEIETTAKTTCESRTAAADKEAKEKVASAEKHAKDLLTAADERSKRIMKEVEQKSRDILSGAAETAEKTVGTAKGKAALLLSESKQRSEKMIADAKAQAEAILAPLQAEVAKEKKALEDVRAESKAFKKKITESYYQQIGMTSELLGFVETDDIPQSAPQAVPAVQEPAPQSAVVSEEDTDIFDSVETAVPTVDDLFTAIEEEVTSGDEPSQEIEAAVDALMTADEQTPAEPVFEAESAVEEPIVEETVTEEPVVEEPVVEAPQEEERFSFVGGFGSLGFDDEEDEENQEIPEESMMNFDDIFNSAIAETPQEPAKATEADTAKPFGELNEKYQTISEDEDDDVFGSFFRHPEPAPEPVVEEPTRQVSLPLSEGFDEHGFEEAEEVEQAEEVEPPKPEKKKHRLSLFSKYADEDDDEDDDDYDEDDYDDEDDDDDEESGGFKGFFRK